MHTVEVAAAMVRTAEQDDQGNQREADDTEEPEHLNERPHRRFALRHAIEHGQRLLLRHHRVAASGDERLASSAQSAHRQRVVVAHLIGHVQLRHAFPGEPLVQVDRAFEAYRDERRYTPVERLDFEANMFAGILLMPVGLVREHVAALGAGRLTDDAIQTLAARFGVSVQGMTLRLATVGLL